MLSANDSSVTMYLQTWQEHCSYAFFDVDSNKTFDMGIGLARYRTTLSPNSNEDPVAHESSANTQRWWDVEATLSEHTSLQCGNPERVDLYVCFRQGLES